MSTCATAQSREGAVEPNARASVRLGIVTPMANERDTAVRFVREVLAECPGFASVTMFVVLDRATSDDTRELLDDYAGTEHRLQVVWAPENRCVVDAYLRGYREALAAGCDWILEIDGGFSHQPCDIPQFFAAMESGADCVFATRFAKGGRISDSSWKRRLVSFGGTQLSNALLGTRLSDMTSGFELFSRSALEMVLRKGIESRGHFFQTEIKFHCAGLRLAEAPIHYRAASARLASSAITESFRQLWRLYRVKRASQGEL